MRIKYFEQRAFAEPLISTPPPSDLGMSIVIPACDEAGLINTLRSLASCQVPQKRVEVLVVINHSETASQEIIGANEASLTQVSSAVELSGLPHLAFHFLYQPDLPARKAGVGLARKIGMDEAARRVWSLDRPDLPIVCLDADCTVSLNYLVELEQFFRTNPSIEGCAIHFEHPLTDLEDWQRKAIIDYELHLRLMIGWQRWAGFPFAYQTVGSSMAVRARAYVDVGGMNTRQAGEDFYFLHKVIERGRFADCTTCTVYPSARISERVPFGTGRALINAKSGAAIKTYHPDTYRSLKALCQVVPHWYDAKETDWSFQTLPHVMQAFLTTQKLQERISAIRSHTASDSAFIKRVFRWFNAFQFMKFAHFARDHGLPNVEVAVSASQLARELGVGKLSEEPEALLTWLRTRCMAPNASEGRHVSPGPR